MGTRPNTSNQRVAGAGGATPCVVLRSARRRATSVATFSRRLASSGGKLTRRRRRAGRVVGVVGTPAAIIAGSGRRQRRQRQRGDTGLGQAQAQDAAGIVDRDRVRRLVVGLDGETMARLIEAYPTTLLSRRVKEIEQAGRAGAHNAAQL